MKRLSLFLLATVALFGIFATVVSASNEGIMLCNNNVLQTDANFFISNDTAYITVSYIGYNNITTHAKITTTLQKRTLLLFWNDQVEWVDTSVATDDIFEHTYPVSSGTYRVKITYEISGTGGATDIIEDEIKVKN